MRTTLSLVLLAFVGVSMSGCGREVPLSPKITTNSTASALRLPGGSLPGPRATLAQHLEGSTGPGSSYAMDVPADWNGDLVLYAHGYTNPAAPVALPNITALRDLLLGQGFAVAYSSFSQLRNTYPTLLASSSSTT